MSADDPWCERDVPLADPCRYRIGPLMLWTCSYANEVRMKARNLIGHHMAVIHEEGLNPPLVETLSPEEESPTLDHTLEWQRWAVGEGASKVRTVPVFPDRPVVVGAEAQYHIHPGSEARAYVRLPVWIRVEIPGREPIRLAEYPSVPLSSTWFGNQSEGELCYWAPSKLRRAARTEAMKPHLALLPLQIENASHEVLAVTNVCLRMNQLSLFIEDGCLWADETRISYQGGGEYSKLRWSGGPPVEVPGAKLVSGPRDPHRGLLTAWTFQKLKDLSGLGAR